MHASVIVPAREERGRIASTLSSLEALRTTAPYEVIAVVAGEDGTRSVARSFDGVRVVEGTGRGPGVDRNRGAAAAAGRYLAFVDADTVVRPDYLAAMTAFVERRDLTGATSRFRFRDADSPRARFVRRVADAYFDRIRNPCLPGFNAVVPADDFSAVGGFPDAPNEDVGLSERLRERGPTAVHPARLVATSARRIERLGLAGVAAHYLRKELRRRRGRRSTITAPDPRRNDD